MKNRKLTVSSARYQDSFDSRDKGGARKPGVLDFKKLGRDISFFKAKEGTNKIDIIPYIIKTKNHPLVKSRILNINDPDYGLDIWVHKMIGPGQIPVICPKKNFNKPCPICEEIGRLYDAGKREEAKALKPSRRMYYNVIPRTGDDTGRLQIFEVSHFLFEKELIEEARNCVDGEDIIPFADIEKGKTIRFRGNPEAFGDKEVIKFKSFSFVERETEITDEEIDNAVSFDELMIIHSYEELAKIFYEGESDGEFDDESEKEFKKQSSVNSNNDELEESEKQPLNTFPTKTKFNCPNGYKFGFDVDTKVECDSCDYWTDCVEFGEENKK